MARGPSGPAFHCLSAQVSLVMARGPSGPAYHCLFVQFAPVMARGPSSERVLRRRPSYHFPFVSFAHLYGVRPEWASCSLFFASFAPVTRHAARRRSERTVATEFAFCSIRPPLWRPVQVLIAFLPNFPPLLCVAQAGQLFVAFLRNLPPFWRAARPRNERSVGGPVIVCLLIHSPTLMARGSSGAAFHRSLPICSICPRYGARPVLGESGP